MLMNETFFRIVQEHISEYRKMHGHLIHYSALTNDDVLKKFLSIDIYLSELIINHFKNDPGFNSWKQEAIEEGYLIEDTYVGYPHYRMVCKLTSKAKEEFAILFMD